MEENTLTGELLEAYIGELQQSPTEEQLAVVLTALRRFMKDAGEVIVAVEPDLAVTRPKIHAMEMEDGSTWIPAFTSFDEQMKGGEAILSTFMAGLKELFQMALEEESLSGVIINPWNRTLMLDKDLIRLVMGQS